MQLTSTCASIQLCIVCCMNVNGALHLLCDSIFHQYFQSPKCDVCTTVQLEILAGIKFGSWAPNCHCKNIKFSGSVRDWWSQSQTAKQPNLIPRQFFFCFVLFCFIFTVHILLSYFSILSYKWYDYVLIVAILYIARLQC